MRPLTAWTGTVSGDVLDRRDRASTSSMRSALVSTITGVAPLSYASTSSRSSRRSLGGELERVHEEHDVDVGGQRLGLGVRTLERGPADEAAASGQELLDPLAVVGHDHPVAHRDVGSEVADPVRRRRLLAGAGSREERRPAAVDASHPSRRPGRRARQGGPRLVEGGVPAQGAQVVRHGATVRTAAAGGQRNKPRPCPIGSVGVTNVARELR